MLPTLAGIRRPFSLCLAFGLLLAACGGGDSSGPASTGILYSGVFAGENGTEAGHLTLTLVAADSNGRGNFEVNGNRRNFTLVTFDGTAFVAAGPGFTFTGTADDTTLSGSYASVSGGGLFTALSKAGGTTPAAYCGTHIGTKNGVPVAGPFAFVQRGNTRLGVFTSVLGDPFRGFIRASTTAGPVTLDTLTGSAAVAASGNTFTGVYLMAGGDSGAVAGNTCPTSVIPPLGTIFKGVLGSFDGTDLGDFNFNLSSTGIGSSGTYKVGGLGKTFLSVISGVGNQVAAFDTTFRFLGTIDTTSLEGRYAKGGSIGGIFAGLPLLPGDTVAKYCGANDNGGSLGSFAFVVRSDSTLFGLFTSGNGSSFQGTVQGKPGDNLTTMEGQTGPATVLPSGGSFGGFYDFSGTGGPSGTVSGSTCL
jgi:hypothetical protein